LLDLASYVIEFLNFTNVRNFEPFRGRMYEGVKLNFFKSK
jgi:hypothetical protein